MSQVSRLNLPWENIEKSKTKCTQCSRGIGLYAESEMVNGDYTARLKYFNLFHALESGSCRMIRDLF